MIVLLTTLSQLAAIVEEVSIVGAEDCIVSTDHGQANSAVPVEGLRLGIAMMLAYGLTERKSKPW